MDELIIQSLQGRTSAEEEDRLRMWRGEAPENDRRYRQLAEIWAVVKVANPVSAEGPVPGVHDLLAQPSDSRLGASRTGSLKGEVRYGNGPRAKRAERLRSRTRTRQLVTGAIAASLVAIGFGIGHFADDRVDSGPLGNGEIVTGAGEMTTVTLGDGSTIRIGPRSRLRVAQERGATVVRLDGRAFFGVQPGANREFRVLTRYGEARVLGTRFEVRSEDEEFRVLVLDGEVSMSAGGREVGLRDGEISRSTRGEPPTTTYVHDVHEHLDWMGRALVFQGTPLQRAAREVERRYGVSFVLDEDLEDLTVTVSFTDEALDDVVLVLCETVGAHCSISENRVEIRKSGGGSDREG